MLAELESVGMRRLVLLLLLAAAACSSEVSFSGSGWSSSSSGSTTARHPDDLPSSRFVATPGVGSDAGDAAADAPISDAATDG